MLIYEAEGFLEVEADSINQLCRSRDHVTFGDAEGNSYDVHAILCDFQDEDQSRCYVAFHDKTLKTALVFSVRSPAQVSSWQHGHAALTGLGYRLDEVKLKLSPAMLEVVLRDIPGLASPVEARRQRDEKAQLLAELQDAVEADPSSAAGRKAALKLGAEKRLGERIAVLRQLLIDTLSPAEERDADGQAMMEQVRDLTAKLEAAESLVGQERKQREISESITEAAEKRIRELEEILVDVETRSADQVKQKRRIVTLKKQVGELEEKLSLVADELASERHKQEQFVTDVKQAHAQIAALEESLQKTEKMLAQSYDQLALEQDLNSQAENSRQEAEGRIRELEEELQGLGRQNSRIAEADQAAAELQGQLEALESELRDLHEEHLRESSLRKELEKSATEDRQRVKELEEALEKAAAEDLTVTAEVDDVADQADALNKNLDHLESRLREEQAEKEGLERELEEAHRIIDSLEKMVRETGKPAAGPELVELAAEVARLNEQVAQERARQKALAEELAETEKRLADRDDPAGKRSVSEKGSTSAAAGVSVVPADSKPDKPRKPLPHELRPAPNKAAFFRPDWDLVGLPCKSAEQVVRVWETVFNVQISLEGYPSQYCMAFLVVAQVDNVKKLFMVYRLKQSKHTLVCVPARTPTNEVQLQKAIEEGLRFLKNSGFEMEEMPKEYIATSLKSYFLKE